MWCSGEMVWWWWSGVAVVRSTCGVVMEGCDGGGVSVVMKSGCGGKWWRHGLRN